METILDHNMTKEERYLLIGKQSDEGYLHSLCFNENSSVLHIAKLYRLRGDIKKSMEYANKLPIRMKSDFLRMYGFAKSRVS